MGEQVTFDNSLNRTVQSKSCDQCFLHKNKCSRHTPCHNCATYRRSCTYERQPQYRRRPQNRTGRRPGRTDHSSGLAILENANKGGVQSLEADSSPEAKGGLNNVAMEVVGRSFAGALSSLNGGPDPGSFDWMNFNFPADMGILDDIERFVNIPVSLEASNQDPFRNLSWTTSPPLLRNSTVANSTPTRTPILVDAWPLINLFLERLHPSMPFFKRSYLIDNINAKRYLHDQPFNALLHAISALTVLQTTSKGPGQPRPLDEFEKAEYLLAEAVRLHSHADFGQDPVLEHILTSFFLFGCQFCKGNHHAARFRLREAVTLAETMGLDDPHTYSNITKGEKERRLRTFLCLTVVHRVYAIQREFPVNEYLLTNKRLHKVQDMVKQVSDRPDVRVVRDLSHMVGLIDFVDATFVRCWRNQCWAEEQPVHVSSDSISGLIQRYTAPLITQASRHDAQQADFLITRHWICHILWSVGSRHGFMRKENSVAQMRPEYALKIACDAIETCESFNMNCLEFHGVGLTEKLYDIVTTALKAWQSTAATPVDLQTSNPAVDQDFRADGTCSAGVLNEHSVHEKDQILWRHDETPTSATMSLSDFSNRYLAVFATFRGGKHPYLKPYMRILCELDLR